MEQSKYSEAVNINKTIDRIEYIMNRLDRYTLTIDEKMTFIDNFIGLYQDSYNPAFKKTITKCLQDLLNKANSDFEKL